MLALAALSVRKGESQKAIEYYLRILEDKPGDKSARACLADLRKEGGPEGLARLIETGRIERLYPGAGRIPRSSYPRLSPWPPRRRSTSPGRSGSLRDGVEAAERRPEVAAVALSRAEMDSPVQTGRNLPLRAHREAGYSELSSGRRIISKHTGTTRPSSRSIASWARTRAPGLRKRRGRFALCGQARLPYDQGRPYLCRSPARPGLYDGCSVVWKGMAANVRPDPD